MQSQRDKEIKRDTERQRDTEVNEQRDTKLNGQRDTEVNGQRVQRNTRLERQRGKEKYIAIKTKR